jgi:hypothetical protein
MKISDINSTCIYQLLGLKKKTKRVINALRYFTYHNKKINYTNDFAVLESSVLAGQLSIQKDLLAFSSLTNCAVRIFIIFKKNYELTCRIGCVRGANTFLNHNQFFTRESLTRPAPGFPNSF